MYQKFLVLFFVTTFSLIVRISSHGMMLKPVGRSSRWRFNNSAPVNYDEDGLYCGGLSVHWDTNKGKCGLCGDDYGDSKPRLNEFGGLYGEGVIVKKYKAGEIVPVDVMLTKNHRGYFEWEICNMDLESESDKCFEKYKLKLEDGSEKYTLPSVKSGWYNTTVKLPQDLTCEHCVLRWTYKCANNWGVCEDGEGRLGCGPQEYFRSCADISIKL